MKLSDKTVIFFVLIIILAFLLRLYRISDFPVSLYTDEADQGYNAYSILISGRDEHGVFLPVSLRSFGDWKPPLPAYLMIPFIRIFGLTELSVRLPSVLLGVGSIVLIFGLVRTFFKENKFRTKLGLLSSLYLSISPWHILQSRSAMLVVISLFFLMLGVYFFLRGLYSKRLFYLSAASFVLSVYAYYGLRLITPLIILFLFIKYRNNLKFCRKELVVSLIIGFMMLVPLFSAFFNQPDVVFGRARTVSVFYDRGVKLRQWELITQDGINAIPAITRFFHNNVYMYARSIVQRFLSHLDIRYLFMAGDLSQPFQIPNMGILNIADIFFIPIGLIILFKQKFRSRIFLMFWIFASILPAAFTFVTPSSNRTFNVVVIYAILSALGSLYIMQKTRFKHASAIITIILVSWSFQYFLHQYFIELSKNHFDYWNYGWKQVVQYVRKEENKFDNIIVSDKFGMPYIYFLFYGKYPPNKFQNEAVRPYVADRFGFEHVEGFGKYLFPNDLDWKFTKENNLQKSALYVIPASEASADADYAHAIYYPNGKIAFKIFSYE